MNPTTITMLHVGVAVLALLVYLARGVLLVIDSPKRNEGAFLGASSLFTLLLFFSGVILAMMLRLHFDNGFVATKMIGLLLFVGVGIISLKEGLAKPTAISLWLAGLLIFAYVYSITIKLIQPLF